MLENSIKETKKPKRREKTYQYRSKPSFLPRSKLPLAPLMTTLMIQTPSPNLPQPRERLPMLETRDPELNLPQVPKEHHKNKPRKTRSTLLQLPRKQLPVMTPIQTPTLMPSPRRVPFQLRESQSLLLPRRRPLAVMMILTVMMSKLSPKESLLLRNKPPQAQTKTILMTSQRNQFPGKHPATLKVKKQPRKPNQMMRKKLKKEIMERKKSLSRTCLSLMMKMESSPFSQNTEKLPTLNW